MASFFLPCPSCARHVRVQDTSCPFCDHALERRAVAPIATIKRTARLSRAALFALGTTTATLAACSDALLPTYGGPPGDAGISFQPSADAPDTADAADAKNDAPPLLDAADDGPPADGGLDQ